MGVRAARWRGRVPQGGLARPLFGELSSPSSGPTAAAAVDRAMPAGRGAALAAVNAAW